MIDRLSILALKIYHTREEAERQRLPTAMRNATATDSPSSKNNAPTLPPASIRLWRETLAGTDASSFTGRLKMYNDPSLNPAIYRNPSQDVSRLTPVFARPPLTNEGVLRIKSGLSSAFRDARLLAQRSGRPCN